MTNPNQIIRQFSTDDANLLQFSQTIHTVVQTNLTDFTDFDPEITAAFLIAFLGQITDTQNFSSDNQLIDVLAQNTMDVEDKMKECRDAFQLSKYYIEQTFPNKPGAWNEFGYNDYDTSRRSHEKMIQFMFDLHETCTKFEPLLIAKGFTAPKIANIFTLATELKAINSTQELSKGQRSHAANDRVLLLNTTWETCRRLCNAGKTIYYNNYGQYQYFLLPWGGDGGTPPPPSNEYNGTIVSGATLNIVIPNLLPTTVLTISNTGDFPLRFCSSDMAGLPCPSGLDLNSGDSLAVTLSNLALPGIVPQFLNISNTIAPLGTPDGEYSITVI